MRKDGTGHGGEGRAREGLLAATASLRHSAGAWKALQGQVIRHDPPLSAEAGSNDAKLTFLRYERGTRPDWPFAVARSQSESMILSITKDCPFLNDSSLELRASYLRMDGRPAGYGGGTGERTTVSG